ncbi:MAG TPA: nitrous oxide-stimulated promoter family protein [Sedimentisphaerales bacterium]|jgi:hypothetical protein|nr:nitrous oxide-stimulated promoter family protein [Sedimentisphaerales bacterium]
MALKKGLAGEAKTIAVMIRMYCGDHHGSVKGALCSDCAGLLEYARARLAKCPFGPDKGPCSKCEVHCYKPELRGRIIEVMRYAGPRMATRHPVLVIRHLLKKRLGRENRR